MREEELRPTEATRETVFQPHCDQGDCVDVSRREMTTTPRVEVSRIAQEIRKIENGALVEMAVPAPKRSISGNVALAPQNGATRFTDRDSLASVRMDAQTATASASYVAGSSSALSQVV